MSPHRREAIPDRPGILGTICDRLCVSPFVWPSVPRHQVPIPFLAQWSLVVSTRLALDPFTEWAQQRPRDAGMCAGSRTGNSRAPDSWHQKAPAAGWGDPRGCRCPFPVEGPRARVIRGGKERRPFRRVTAAESRWLTHPGRPSLPGLERPGPGQPWEREMPPVGASGPELGLLGHWGRSSGPGTPLYGLVCACGALPGRLVLPHPGPSLQGLNPVLPKH